MSRNVEIKARTNNFAAQLELARQISDQDKVTLEQKDTFFKVAEGRLKLREFASGPAQLIFYDRVDTQGPKLSDYHITATDDAKGLSSILEKAYGIRHIIKKVRQLFMVGRTRLHFDKVDGLGEFIELEVVLNDNDGIEDGEIEAQQLMQKLGISKQDLIDEAYVDLAEAVRTS